MLKYSEAIYQGKIDQLTEYISMLNGHVEKLTAYKEQLKDFWNDSEGETLGKALQAALTNTNNQLFYLRKQLAFYKKMVAEYSGAAADVQSNIENVLQTMSSIGGVVSMTMQASMRLEIEDSKLQRQMDLVQEELREIQLIKELFFIQPTLQTVDGTAYLLWQEKQIRRRISFLESVHIIADQLHTEVGKEMELLLSDLKELE